MTESVREELRHSQEGLLRKDFCLLWLRAEVPLNELLGPLDEHHQYMARLEGSGHVFACGPVLDDSGDPTGDSVWIVRGNAEEAQAIAAEDPLSKLGLRSFEVTRWRMNMGSFGISIRFSTGEFQLD